MGTGLGLSHIGITVTDLPAALEWYSEVLGFEVRIPVTESVASGPDGPMMRDMLGERFASVRHAMLSTGSGVFLELFESIDPATERAPQPAVFWRTGPWHIAVTSDDLDGLRTRISDSGGSAVSKVHDLVPGKPFKFCMCVDPFGVEIEIYSHPIEEILAAMTP